MRLNKINVQATLRVLGSEGGYFSVNTRNHVNCYRYLTVETMLISIVFYYEIGCSHNCTVGLVV